MAAMVVPHANSRVRAVATVDHLPESNPPNSSGTILTKAADALAGKPDAFDAMMSEIGATEGWTCNLMLAVSIMHETAALPTPIAGEVILSDKSGWMEMAQREPVGIILGIES
ncbi:hypothetical protein HL653_11605 [Sphingomonas sp. AP4-R1]|uniref:hypothetical protein n=1 Tax=Sphingomonas sp. AP4-R1 TaxID=2735134 RepID=UPI00149348AC|nr:hypothetical protein HL653_11605 [Sphingomonas sp. AP4-R1]